MRLFLAPERKRRLAVVLGLSVWAAAASAGLVALTAHGATAGRPADAPAVLGAELPSTLRASGRATLVMVAHPKCPCTRASLRELARILASSPQSVEVVVLFATSRNAGEDRITEDLRAMAARISGARVVDDLGGAIAAGLGAHTSGTVVFFDRAGALRFSGGITPSRGHEGDSAGAERLRSLLAEQLAEQGHARATPRPASTAAVYGCALSTEKATR